MPSQHLVPPACQAFLAHQPDAQALHGHICSRSVTGPHRGEHIRRGQRRAPRLHRRHRGDVSSASLLFQQRCRLEVDQKARPRTLSPNKGFRTARCSPVSPCGACTNALLFPPFVLTLNSTISSVARACSHNNHVMYIIQYVVCGFTLFLCEYFFNAFGPIQFLKITFIQRGSKPGSK